MFNFARSLAKKADSQNWLQDNTSTSALPGSKPFLEMSQDLMLILDSNGTILQSNKSLLSMLGTEPNNLDGATFASLFNEADRAIIRETIQTMQNNAASMRSPSVTFETSMTDDKGSPRWIAWQASGQGAYTYCIGRDITDIKHQHNALILHEKQLREAESIGRLGRWTWHVGQETIDWSEQIYRIWGVNAETFTPSFAAIYEMVHEDDQDRMDQTLQRALINQNDFDVDFAITLRNGEQRYIRCDGRCALDSEGSVIALYGIMQDMTQHMLHERDLRAAKEAAEHAYAAKTQFLANMSHELRTPLNAIIGFSEMIESQMFGPLGSEKYAEYATDIRQSGGYLLDLISDILDMSKIEAGKYELDLEEVQINAIVENAIKMVKARAQETGITINTPKTFNDNTQIIADRRACLQIMLNILSNAVKFTRKNGQIDITCTAAKETITIQIRDTGIGIPANKLATITNPFEQVSPHHTRNHEGSGLGLAITKELVNMHGGTLMIESQINVGTNVTITLPTEQHS
jgi:two-component system cell cycle sensor histidine kinase PleC